MNKRLINEVMNHCRCRSKFVRKVIRGNFVVESGAIDLDLKDEQYFIIGGSVFNDGLHQHPAVDLKDEEFYGEVVALAIPSGFLEMCEKIQEFNEAHANDQYVSESFGGYSYSRATNKSGNLAGWKDVFKSDLNDWRML